MAEHPFLTETQIRCLVNTSYLQYLTYVLEEHFPAKVAGGTLLLGWMFAVVVFAA